MTHMRQIFYFIAILFLLWGCTKKRESEPNIIPLPLKCELTQQQFVLSGSCDITFDAPRDVAENIAEYLKTTILHPHDTKKTGTSNIVFRITDSIPGLSSPEGYKITTDKKSITILSTSESGLFYGCQTILQAIDNEGGMPCGVIIDEPRFAYRGMMLDVSRHFFDKEFVKKQIDAMARYKMNRLHLHLTDAAGWRLEIKKYGANTVCGRIGGSLAADTARKAVPMLMEDITHRRIFAR